jgi:hypothetical protein
MEHDRQLCTQETLEITQKGNKHMQNMLYMTREGVSSVNATSLAHYNALHYADQQMHSLYVNNILHIISTPTYFNVNVLLTVYRTISV